MGARPNFFTIHRLFDSRCESVLCLPADIHTLLVNKPLNPLLTRSSVKPPAGTGERGAAVTKSHSFRPHRTPFHRTPFRRSGEEPGNPHPRPILCPILRPTLRISLTPGRTLVAWPGPQPLLISENFENQAPPRHLHHPPRSVPPPLVPSPHPPSAGASALEPLPQPGWAARVCPISEDLRRHRSAQRANPGEAVEAVWGVAEALSPRLKVPPAAGLVQNARIWSCQEAPAVTCPAFHDILWRAC